MSDDLQTLIQSHLDRGDVVGWFEDLYARANGEPKAVPWTHMAPRRELVEWAFERQPDGSGQAALVIGCGLGDDAELLAGLNYDVTAFDVSRTAIDWCRRRFPDSSVTYEVADMFDPPNDWRQAFDLVVEVYTVQALPPEMRRQSVEAVASFVAPGGTLIAVGRGLKACYERCGPPWPLTPEELALFEEVGLKRVRLDRKNDPDIAPTFRYRAEFRRPQTK